VEDFHGSERRNGGSFFKLSKEGALGEHVELSPHSYSWLVKLRHGQTLYCGTSPSGARLCLLVSDGVSVVASEACGLGD
jgi:hypothetical protein